MSKKSKPFFNPVDPHPNFPQLEEKIIKYWKKHKIFEKSITQRSKDNPYSFYDGPPFVTGHPHYGHITGSIAKDVIPRYFTMKGKRIRRVWGWDCHGLPVEEKTEKKLGLKNRRDIEKIGVNKFIKECRKYVSETSAEWNWYIDHIGRWVDMDHAYRTMDLQFMESVIWAFKKLWDQDLIYQGLKTLLYCTRCGTPVSKFEISMDDSYALMKDPAITIKFLLTQGTFANSHLLAWTTTPWTLPSNRALVIDPQATYIQIKLSGHPQPLILAQKRASSTICNQKHQVLKKFKGQKLIGHSYQPLYQFFPRKSIDFQVFSYPGMVNMEEGTGVVHSAPGFGEIDTEMGKHYQLTLTFSVDDEGKFVNQVKPWAGIYVKNADPQIIQDLKSRDLLFKQQTISHRYPYCYRCETPLIYKAVKAWFVNIQKIKNRMLKLNQKVNWVPSSLKNKRVKNTISDAPDWCISRTRYWATVMPIWQCTNCQEFKVAGSVKEIEKYSIKKVKITDLHRTGVDHIQFQCSKCQSRMSRIPEVLDVWFESGSMPYGERHYPFENKAVFEKAFPADYIVEYTGQIRAWFYYLHALSTALFDSHCFKNVVVTGVMAGSDGRKMSKTYGNYPDPRLVLEKHGGDALRLYLMGNPIMLAQDTNITHGEEIAEQAKTTLIPLWNCYKFFVTFANLHHWQPNIKHLGGATHSNSNKFQSLLEGGTSILDRWMLSRLNLFHHQSTKHLDNYHLPPATQLIRDFISDLSRWYIRRSRNRFSQGNLHALSTLYHTLKATCLTTAPIIPFISEEIFKNLTNKNSVHLQNWPSSGKINHRLLNQMNQVRKICELGHAERKKAQIPVRQPLAKITIKTSQPLAHKQLIQLIQDELNIKQVEFKKTKSSKSQVTLDTKLTPQLKAEGQARKIIRSIQTARKKAGCSLTQKVQITLPNWPADFTDHISQTTLSTLKKGGQFSLKKI
jgi:isoleucyl-tRNA synthetase